MVFSSARRYRSMKYSWQKMQAPFLRPSMVDALMISSISGTLNPFSPSAILRPRHLNCLSLVEVNQAIKAWSRGALPPSIDGRRLDDQLDLRHAEPVFTLSHPEASSPQLSLSCRSESSNK